MEWRVGRGGGVGCGVGSAACTAVVVWRSSGRVRCVTVTVILVCEEKGEDTAAIPGPRERLVVNL